MKDQTYYVCNECKTIISEVSIECGGTIYCCPECGEMSSDEVTAHVRYYEPQYDTTKERDLDLGLY